MGGLVLIEGQKIRTHRCEDGFPGVVVADVLAPFGKRADAVSSLWYGWGRVRTEMVGPILDGSNGDPRRKKTMLLHVEDVPLLLARLDHRGMTTEVKRLFLQSRLDRCCPVCRRLPPVAPRITFTEG